MKCPACKQEAPKTGAWKVSVDEICPDGERVLYWVIDDVEGAPVGQEGSLEKARETLREAVSGVVEKGGSRAAAGADLAGALDYAAVECAAFEMIREKPELTNGMEFSGITWNRSLVRVLSELKVRATVIANGAFAAAAGTAPRTPEETLRAVLEDPRFGGVSARVRGEILQLFIERNQA